MSLLGSALLDTSVVVEHFRGNPKITGALESFQALFVPSIVAGELCYGALRSDQFEKRWQQLLTFLQAVTIIPVHCLTGDNFSPKLLFRGFVSFLFKAKALLESG